jgi:hypothetical protein
MKLNNLLKILVSGQSWIQRISKVFVKIMESKIQKGAIGNDKKTSK